ncbi:hypothetical protein OFN39_01765 [Escherichia coli]|nr:hypothetical protein [Escherichia coli]
MAQDAHWYLPQNAEQLTHFYFIICFCYMAVHIVWDCASKVSPPFKLENLPGKVAELYSSTTFATSVFFIVMLFDINNPLRTSDAFIFPLITAAGTGLLISIAAIAPKAKA